MKPRCSSPSRTLPCASVLLPDLLNELSTARSEGHVTPLRRLPLRRSIARRRHLGLLLALRLAGCRGLGLGPRRAPEGSPSRGEPRKNSQAIADIPAKDQQQPRAYARK